MSDDLDNLLADRDYIHASCIDPRDAPVALLLRTLHDPDADHGDREAAQDELLRRGAFLPQSLLVKP